MIISPKTVLRSNSMLTSPNYTLDRKSQVQPNGIDLRVRTIMKLEVNDMRPFKLWADGEKEVVNAGAAEGTIMHGDEGFVLRRGYAYEATCYEYVKIPKQVVAFIYGRSTLHRNGIFCRASVYDSGFEDYAGLMIFPFCDFWVEKRTRIAQIVFMQSQGDSMYNGQYGKQGRSKRVEM